MKLPFKTNAFETHGLSTSMASIASKRAVSLQCTADNLLLRDVPDRKELKNKILWKVLVSGSIEPDEIAMAVGIELKEAMDLVFELLRAGQLRRT